MQSKCGAREDAIAQSASRTARRTLVLYVQYADPAAYPPVERSADQFRTLGWDVKFLGIGAAGQLKGLAPSGPRAFELELGTHKKGGLCAMRSYLNFWLHAFWRVRREKPDFVYCSDLLSYPAGLLISLTTQTRTILHEHDPPVAEPNSAFQRSLHWCRRLFSRRAELCIVPQTERAESFVKETGAKQVSVVYNCPSLSEIAALEDRKPSSEFILWHHGSLNPARFPSSLLRALTLLPDNVRLEVAGYETESSVGYMSELGAEATRLGLSSRFTFLGAMPRQALFERARKADLGIVLFTDALAIPMVGASVKPFDYLACGLPLLVNNSEEWRRFYVARGVAKAADPTDAAAIAAAIAWFYDNPASHLEMVKLGHQLLLSEWNYDTQFRQVLDHLHEFARPDRHKI